MLKFIIGALVIVLIVWLIAHKKQSKKPFPQRLIDWLLARELAEDKPKKQAAPARGAQQVRRQQQPKRQTVDPDQTAYIRPQRRPQQPTEITLSYAPEIGGSAHYLPVDHLPLRVGARSDCDCVIDNDTISRQHFEVIRDAYGEVAVRNLSRTNGIIPINARTGHVEEPILEPGVTIPVDRESGTLRFWAGELYFELRLQAAPRKAYR